MSLRLPWPDIDDVLLDMDGTLLDLAFDNHFWQRLLPQRYAQRHGMTEDAAREALAPHFERTLGTLDWYCIDFWHRQTGVDVGALKREVAKDVRLLPETTAFLDALKQRDKRLWLVTNAHPDTLAIKLERAPIAHYFDRIVSSHELAAPKEHPGFWEGLRARHPFDPQRAVLVDDSEAVLKAGHAFGLGHIVTAAWPDRGRPMRQNTAFPAVRVLTELLDA
ncbi:MAG: GMP/IMP nucleotidase [Algiphilus sp.]